MQQIKNRRRFSAQGVIALGFLFIILAAALLLTLPVSAKDRQWTSPMTALFTAASAVCVTGLTVVDTATHWSLFGRAVILLAIQTGGLGVMTVTALLALMLHRQIGLRQRSLLAESVAALQIGGVVRLVRRALLGTLLIESIGALLLSIRFVPMLGLLRGVGVAAFHAVSAFCNAGFDLMGSVSGPFSSLEAFAGDPLTTLTVCALILLGGLGFFVWNDLIACRFRFRRLHLHSRAVLLLTPPLVLLPAVVFFFCEKEASMAGFSPGARLLAALFSSVTPRTAGFNTVPTASLSPAGTLLTLLLMLIGGNPGSTAGGAKTTTLLILWLLTVSALQGREDVCLMGRRIPSELTRRTCAVLIVYLLMIFLSALCICLLQPGLPALGVLLEVVSAVNTVGMSAGVTRLLSPAPLCVLMLLMYAGRLGSLSFLLLLAGPSRSAPVRYPADRLLVG